MLHYIILCLSRIFLSTLYFCMVFLPCSAYNFSSISEFICFKCDTFFSKFSISQFCCSVRVFTFLNICDRETFFLVPKVGKWRHKLRTRFPSICRRLRSAALWISLLLNDFGPAVRWWRFSTLSWAGVFLIGSASGWLSSLTSASISPNGQSERLEI